jgi:FixJ family two-component response regulator
MLDDGISATQSIRQYDRRTPIVMTSNVCDVETLQKYGMTDFLQKPLDPFILCHLLERYCAHLVKRKQESIVIPR